MKLNRPYHPKNIKNIEKRFLRKPGNLMVNQIVKMGN